MAEQLKTSLGIWAGQLDGEELREAQREDAVRAYELVYRALGGEA